MDFIFPCPGPLLLLSAGDGHNCALSPLVVLVRMLLYSVMAVTVHCHRFVVLGPLTPVGPVDSPFILPVIAFGIFTVPNQYGRPVTNG
jgi:hypothetical protein